jgi:hypothetical protein
MSWEANRRPYLSGRSLGRRWAIPAPSDSAILRPRNLASEPEGATPRKDKNNTNEASMLLKKQGEFGKRTQNEPKTNSILSAKCGNYAKMPQHVT